MKTRVYRNLITGKWSIQQRKGGDKGAWHVVGHTDSCVLHNVTVWVGPGEQARAKREQVRNVHLMAEGDLVKCAHARFKDRTPIIEDIASDYIPAQGRRVTYNPMVHDTMVYKDGGDAYTGSQWAIFTTCKTMETV